MIERGAIAASVELKNASSVPVVQLQVARALATLADAETLSANDRNDILVPLTQLSRSADYGVQRYAALGLANLALHDERQVDVIKEYMRLHIEQHSDAVPRMNAPQRVPVPAHFNAPKRIEGIGPVPLGDGGFSHRNSVGHMSRSGSNASLLNNSNVSKTSAGRNASQKGLKRLGRSASAASLVPGSSGATMQTASLTVAPQPFNAITTHGGSRRRLKDLAVLSDACRRAGRTRMEGHANFNMGVMYDNLGTNGYRRAQVSYEEYLCACRLRGDVVGEALAYNSLGVNLQKQAESVAEDDEEESTESSDRSTVTGSQNASAVQEDAALQEDVLTNAQKERKILMQKAVSFHSRHCDCADISGKFISLCNLGLCHAQLGLFDESAHFYRRALRYALRMYDLHVEGVALGSLGSVGLSVGDIATAQACMERYLHVSHILKDKRGQGDAYQKLGEMANLRGDFKEAARCFRQAQFTAETLGDDVLAAEARASYGVAKGNDNMEDMMAKVSNDFR